MAVVISNETGVDIYVHVEARGEDGLIVRAFFKKPKKKSAGAFVEQLKQDENVVFWKWPKTTKVYHDLSGLGIKVWTRLSEAAVRNADGERVEALVLTLTLKN